MNSLANYEYQRKVKSADDKHMLWGVLILFLVFWVGKLFARKKPVGTVEVGQGEFGEFDTDGDFKDEEEEVEVDFKTPGYVPGVIYIPNLGDIFSGSVKENLSYAQNGTGGSGCGPTCIK